MRRPKCDVNHGCRSRLMLAARRGCRIRRSFPGAPGTAQVLASSVGRAVAHLRLLSRVGALVHVAVADNYVDRRMVMTLGKPTGVFVRSASWGGLKQGRLGEPALPSMSSMPPIAE